MFGVVGRFLRDAFVPQYYHGRYNGQLVAVLARTPECKTDCARAGLRAYDGDEPFNLNGYTLHEHNGLAPGITCWWGRPDPDVVRREADERARAQEEAERLRAEERARAQEAAARVWVEEEEGARARVQEHEEYQRAVAQSEAEHAQLLQQEDQDLLVAVAQSLTEPADPAYGEEEELLLAIALSAREETERVRRAQEEEWLQQMQQHQQEPPQTTSRAVESARSVRNEDVDSAGGESPSATSTEPTVQAQDHGQDEHQDPAQDQDETRDCDFQHAISRELRDDPATDVAEQDDAVEGAHRMQPTATVSATEGKEPLSEPSPADLAEKCECPRCMSGTATGLAHDTDVATHRKQLPIKLNGEIQSLCVGFIQDVTRALNGMHANLPQLDVHIVCTESTLKARGELESSFLSGRYPEGLRKRALDLLDENLEDLKQYFSRFNASRRSKFAQSGTGIPIDGLPSRAIVVSDESEALRVAMTQVLAEKHACLGGKSVQDKLNESEKDRCYKLVQFHGRDWQSIRERSEILEPSRKLNDYKIRLTVTVSESSPCNAYVLSSMETSTSVANENVDALSTQATSGWSANAGYSPVGTFGFTSGTNVNRTGQRTRATATTIKGYDCCIRVTVVIHVEVVRSPKIKVGNAKDVTLSVAPTATQVEITLNVPSQAVISAWAAISGRDLLHLLMGDPLVRLRSVDRGSVVIDQAANTSALLLTKRNSAGRTEYDISTTIGAVFKLHVGSEDDPSFSLSVFKKGPVETDPSTGKLWVGLDSDGRLVFSETKEHFTLRHDGLHYDRFVLHAESRGAFVTRGHDGRLIASAAKAEEGKQLIFARVCCAMEES